jgi:hypothetical protein
MPKIRDLGINAIPLTMQPPEIGDGGGGGKPDENCDARNTTDRENCDERNTTDRENCDERNTTDRANCDERNTTDRDDITCREQRTTERDDMCDQPMTTEVQSENCRPKSQEMQQASGFSPTDVAMLRQQLDQQLGDQP